MTLLSVKRMKSLASCSWDFDQTVTMTFPDGSQVPVYEDLLTNLEKLLSDAKSSGGGRYM